MHNKGRIERELAEQRKVRMAAAAGRPVIVFCTVAYRHLTTPTHHCIVRELFGPGGLAIDHSVDLCDIGNDALISRTRSKVLSGFLQSPADVLFWTDADIVWHPGNVRRLIASARKTRGIVAGIVPKRGFGLGHAMRWAPEIPEGMPISTPEDKLIPASYVGFAFSAIHKDAVEAVAPDLPVVTGNFNSGEQDWRPFCMPFIVDWPAENRKDMLSEDWAFCKRALDHKVPIHVDCMPVCGHIGEHTFSLQDACANGRTQRLEAAA